jgi:hypothetical protein
LKSVIKAEPSVGVKNALREGQGVSVKRPL